MATTHFRGHEEEPEKGHMDITVLRRLWPFVRPYRRAFALCLLTESSDRRGSDTRPRHGAKAA